MKENPNNYIKQSYKMKPTTFVSNPLAHVTQGRGFGQGVQMEASRVDWGRKRRGREGFPRIMEDKMNEIIPFIQPSSVVG